MSPCSMGWSRRVAVQPRKDAQRRLLETRAPPADKGGRWEYGIVRTSMPGSSRLRSSCPLLLDRDCAPTVPTPGSCDPIRQLRIGSRVSVVTVIELDEMA